MNIFIIPTSYPNINNPVKDIFIYEQAKQLAKMGHRIVVLHVEKLPTSMIISKIDKKIIKIDDGFATRYTIKQKTIVEDHLPNINKKHFVKNMFNLFEHAVKEEGKPDVLYAHFSRWAGYSACLISKQYSIPLVTIEHFGGILKGPISNSLNKCLKFTIENSAYFLCVSERLRSAIKKSVNPIREIFVVSNMIDDSFVFSPHIEKEYFTICSVGRLTKSKNFSDLINAFCIAFDSSDKVLLRIVGDGEEKSKLQKLVIENNRQHQIKFLGSLSREQTVKEYVRCDCFALASSWETFGIVYREALATGRPIITTNHGGFSQFDWHNEYGYMVEVGDVKSFAESLKKIKCNYQFDGELISKLCLNDCSANVIGKILEQYLLKAKEGV